MTRERALVLGDAYRKGRPHICPLAGSSQWVVYFAWEPSELVRGLRHEGMAPIVTFWLCPDRAAAYRFAETKRPRFE